MEPAKLHGIYGMPPKNLAPLCPPGATQFSPLEPDSAALENAPAGSLSSFTMLAPPGTLERRYQLAQALRALKTGAPLVAMAPKDKGGNRIRKELESFGCEVLEDSKSHHKICTAARPASPTLEEALFEGRARFVDSIALWSQPGIFSWDRIDPGSELLVRLLPELSGRGADLGAGLGFLTRAVIKSRKVQQMSLVEIDRRAVECARKNLETEKARLAFHWADLRRADTGISGLDFIVTNPPFHDGGTEDQSLGQGFIQQAAYLLKPGGELWLVANKHLPYEELLRSLFQRVELLEESGGFKAYRARR